MVVFMLSYKGPNPFCIPPLSPHLASFVSTLSWRGRAMRDRLIAFLGSLWFLTSCFVEPNHAVLMSIDSSKTCMDGGAILDLTSGECICPGRASWDGSACEGMIPSTPLVPENMPQDSDLAKDAVPEEHKAVYDSLPQEVKVVSDERGPPAPTDVRTKESEKIPPATDEGIGIAPMQTEESAKEVASESDSREPLHTETDIPEAAEAPSKNESHVKVESGAKTGASSKDHGSQEENDKSSKKGDSGKGSVQQVKPLVVHQQEAIRQICKAARAEWMAHDASCKCPNGRVLVGKKCEKFKGKLTAVECQSAIYRGKWRQGSCLCDSGKEFSLSRGGCVPGREKAKTAAIAMLRRSCENSRNLGAWDSRRDRCQCPLGRIWQDEQCVAQSSMTSRQVCTSDFNRGRWDTGRKRCECPGGAIWLDQRCQIATAVSEMAACESEANTGRWILASRTCRCPGGKTWNRSRKICT
jgi:hypothetical protein